MVLIIKEINIFSIVVLKQLQFVIMIVQNQKNYTPTNRDLSEEGKTEQKKIIQKLLPEKSLNRTGKKIKIVKAIVIHWTEVPNQKPEDTINYWANTNRKGSAHYVIGTNGEIYQAIPDDEQARHAGSNDGIYKDIANNLFGDGINPNIYSIGIEMEPINDIGEFSNETYSSAVELTILLCTKFDLNPNISVIRHYDVTGKDCPKYFVNNEDKWIQFKNDVISGMEE